MACPPESLTGGFHRLCQTNHRPLLQFLGGCSAPLALSFPWGLTERWLTDGYHDVLSLCSELMRGDVVEFVGSAAYHPILPLLPRPAVASQIVHDTHHHRELFGDWACAGFVPPEMAFGPELIPLLKENGYSWCAVDDTTYCCLTDQPPKNHIAECGGLPILLRSSLWSKALVGTARSGACGQTLALEMMKGLSEWFQDEVGYGFLALDAECLGLHRSGSLESFYQFLDSIQDADDFQLVTPSQLLEQFPARVDEVPPGTWRTTAEQFWEGEFFVPWQSRYNQVHTYLWELTELAVESVAKLQERLDRSLHSGFFWAGDEEQGTSLSSKAEGVRTLLDVISAAAPEDMDRALELAARLDNFSP